MDNVPEATELNIENFPVRLNWTKLNLINGHVFYRMIEKKGQIFVSVNGNIVFRVNFG